MRSLRTLVHTAVNLHWLNYCSWNIKDKLNGLFFASYEEEKGSVLFDIQKLCIHAKLILN